MTYHQLRALHSQLTYTSYDFHATSNLLTITYHFRLHPDIDFHPKIEIPFQGVLDTSRLNTFAFHLGLVEAISYWKIACPPIFKIEAGQLDTTQTQWWHELFVKGLGEFFYRNEIDFTKDELLTITSNGKVHASSKKNAQFQKPLIMASGGKDTAVTLDLLRQSRASYGVLVNNPYLNTEALLEVVQMKDPIRVRRLLDQKLKSLNTAGYLNGHTPFSAYLAFLGVLVADLYGYGHVIVSNEQSANQANVFYKGHPINHQYSKSYEFESSFRTYCAQYLSRQITYFSLLRPLNELQINKRFATRTEFHKSAISCNKNRGNSWCGTCPKCMFAYLMLLPFLDKVAMSTIFSKNFLEIDKNYSILKNVVGLGTHKPWECVGTFEESQIAVYLAHQKHSDIPVLKKLLSQLNRSDSEFEEIAKHTLIGWSDAHFIPSEYMSLVKKIATYE